MARLDHPVQIQPSDSTVQAIAAQRKAFPPGYPHFPGVWNQLAQNKETDQDILREPHPSTARLASATGSADGIVELRNKWEAKWRHNDNPLAPPPPGIFPDRDSAVTFAKAWVKDRGYRLIVAHSRTDRSGGQDSLLLRCGQADKNGGKSRIPPELRKRNRFSRKTNCPFSVRVRKRKDTPDWLLSEGHSMHNHAAEDSTGSPGPAVYPDLEAALWGWQQTQPQPVHGARLKVKAGELFVDMPQYQGLAVPEFDRVFLEGYRTRHGVQYRAMPRAVPELVNWSEKMQPTAAASSEEASAPTTADVLVVPEHAGCQAREDTAFINVLDSSSPDPLLVAVRDAVRAHMSHYDASHDWDHILRVLSLSKALVRGEQNPRIDEQAVWLAALTHDLNDHKYLQPGEDATSVITNLLTSHGCPAQLAEKVQTVATHVSYSNELRAPAAVNSVLAQHPELGIVQDADRLDAIGAIGISRTFVFTGAKRPGAGMEESIIHFGEKLERLESMMKTATGRKMAAKRTERLRVFRGWWEEEYALVA